MSTTSKWIANLVVICSVVASTASAGSPIDESSKLETIATDFGMCDGPAWDGNSALYVPDVKGGKLLRYRPGPKKLETVLADAGRISASYFTLGHLYLADNGESSIARLDGGKKVRLGGQDKNAKPPIRPNDLVVDNSGGVYYTLTGQGKVIYLAPDGQQTTAIERIDSPNGLVLSPDESVLYVASYAPKKIWAYEVTAPGKVTGGRVFAAMDDGPEKGADGMTIDRAGNVYCAGASDIWIWSPTGKLLAKLATPTRPINCEFGDSDMHSLYIAGLGGLYRQRMHVTGRPPQPPLTVADEPKVEGRPSAALPSNITAHLDVVYAQYGARKLLADIFLPNDRARPMPAIVVVHGGGWMNGDKTKFRAMAVNLAARGYVTAAIEYRLSEDAHFPAAIQDCNAAVRFLRAHAADYKVDPERIGAVGGSAGAHLVGLMAAAPDVATFQGVGGNGNQSSRLQAAVAMAGPMQLDTGSVAERAKKADRKSYAYAFLGKTIDEDRKLYEQASPYTHFTQQTPPILFITGELDNPERDQASLEKLKSLGVWAEQKVYARGKHGCWNQLPWFDQIADDIDRFFKDKLK